ncbi:MAG: ribosome maturation factor RimP [Micromonosporaceae bacterium]
MARSGRAGAASRSGRPSSGTDRPASGSGNPRERERLRAAVAPVVADASYDLEKLVISRAGSRSVVRIVVDGDEGVSSDAIADISREISAALDAAEQSDGPLLSGGYTLEVSSPGIDRPLTEPRHWRRNRGRLVKVRIGEATRTGRILAADDDGVRLDLDGDVDRFPYPELGPGKVQIEFGRASGRQPSEDGSERDDEGKEGA